MIQSTHQIWTIIGFKLNQAYIEKNLCQNRFDKIPLCKGSCVLEKKLNDNEQKQNQLPNLKLKVITLFHINYLVYSSKNIRSILVSDKQYKTESSVVVSCPRSSLFRPPNIIA